VRHFADDGNVVWSEDKNAKVVRFNGLKQALKPVGSDVKDTLRPDLDVGVVGIEIFLNGVGVGQALRRGAYKYSGFSRLRSQIRLPIERPGLKRMPECPNYTLLAIGEKCELFECEFEGDPLCADQADHCVGTEIGAGT